MIPALSPSCSKRSMTLNPEPDLGDELDQDMEELPPEEPDMDGAGLGRAKR